MNEIEVSSIMRVRYRDIPWDEVSPHIPDNPDYNETAWSNSRGKTVVIETPPVETPRNALCEGPFYACLGPESGSTLDDVVLSCIHILEIGD